MCFFYALSSRNRDRVGIRVNQMGVAERNRRLSRKKKINIQPYFAVNA
jgi:hypothetical protein